MHGGALLHWLTFCAIAWQLRPRRCCLRWYTAPSQKLLRPRFYGPCQWTWPGWSSPRPLWWLRSPCPWCSVVRFLCCWAGFQHTLCLWIRYQNISELYIRIAKKWRYLEPRLSGQKSRWEASQYTQVNTSISCLNTRTVSTVLVLTAACAITKTGLTDYFMLPWFWSMFIWNNAENTLSISFCCFLSSGLLVSSSALTEY